jgi:hypothetical protein
VDAHGVPLSLAVSGANVHDVKLLTRTLDRLACPRPKARKGKPQPAPVRRCRIQGRSRPESGHGASLSAAHQAAQR